MLPTIATQLGIMIVLFFILLITKSIITSVIVRNMRKQRQDRQQISVVRKFINITFVITIIITVGLVVGYDVGNIWLTLASVAGLIAIGFIAVWSVLSNIVCAMIILITQPYKIDQKITILPEDITGVVDEITLFFTIIQDKKGNLIHIPNNMMFQRMFTHVVKKDKK